MCTNQLWNIPIDHLSAPVPSSQIARCQNDVVFVAMVTHVKDLQMQSKEVWAPPQKGPRKIFWMDFRRVMVKFLDL